jgi:predicted DNA-binding antitoxin AbrB/MazE fold protein
LSPDVDGNSKLLYTQTAIITFWFLEQLITSRDQTGVKFSIHIKKLKGITMQALLNAIYKNGILILEERLGIEKEGKRFKVILLEQESSKAKKERFFEFIDEHSFKLHEDYKFDREKLHER